MTVTYNTYKRGLAAALVMLASVLLVSGCGSTPAGSSAAQSSAAAPEVNPAGDIPDTQAYVPFTVGGGTFTVSVPEGWARSSDGGATVFTDKTNAVRLAAGTQPTAPTVDSVKSQVLPALATTTPGYQPGAVSVVHRKAGPAVLATYKATSSPNPVTGKTETDAVERYEFWRDGHTAVLTLSGPVGADNVDPWKTITDSLTWQ